MDIFTDKTNEISLGEKSHPQPYNPREKDKPQKDT